MKTKYSTIGLTLILYLCGMAVARPFSLKTDRFSIHFAADGKVASILSSQGTELLNTAEPGKGFIICNQSGQEIGLTKLDFENQTLVASSVNNTQAVRFLVKQCPTYLAFYIQDTKGLPATNNLSVKFQANIKGYVRVFEADYMTNVFNDESSIEVQWLYLNNRSKSNPRGGFILYSAENEQDEDDILLRIWSGEQLVHPKVEGGWTYERAKEWVNDWQVRFADQGQFMLEADNLEDLFKGVQYAEMADIKNIYLFTNTWRGGFWTTNQGNVELLKSVFPDGRKDLRRYADYLKSKNINLRIHYISGGIGFWDPHYATQPDDRLASWGRGRLEGDIDASAVTLRFIPDPGVELPYIAPVSSDHQFRVFPPAVYNYHGFSTVRIGSELIQVGRYEQTEDKVWVFENCQRGLYDTQAVSHRQGDPVTGLYDTYQQNFIPDNDSTLLEEIAAGYAGLLNECGISHTEFDGAEIHNYNGLWGSGKFMSLVYGLLDHPVTAGSSHAAPPPCNLEYRFNSTKKLLRGFNWTTHGGYSAPIILEAVGRSASKPLDAHFTLSKGAAAGSSRYSLNKPEPLFGLTVRELETYGKTSEMTEIIRMWKRVNVLLSEQQRKILSDSFKPAVVQLNDGSRDVRSEIVHTVSHSEKGYAITPVKIMTRDTGDIDWHSWQEHGPIEPMQYVRVGDKLKLKNPFKTQSPRFIIRILSEMNYLDSDNINLQPHIDHIKNRSDTMLNEHGDGLQMTLTNRQQRDVWETENLPSWKCSPMDMTGHRGIGFYLTGDGSESMFLLKIPGRDYVQRIDFSGRRYIEIPNGEAAWANGFWGWRVGTHRASYENITGLVMGFGFVKANSNSNIVIEGLKALKEIPGEIKNPMIHVNNGTLRIPGTFSTGSYLEYEGGDSVDVYDKNWNKIQKVNIRRENYSMPNGYAEIHISADDNKGPWLEVQFFVEDDPLIVADK